MRCLQDKLYLKLFWLFVGIPLFASSEEVGNPASPKRARMPLPETMTGVWFAGGDGSSPRRAVDIRGATGLVQFVRVQADWMSNISSQSELQRMDSASGKYEAFLFQRRGGATVSVFFKPAPIGTFHESVECLWASYMDELVKPVPDLLFAIHRKTLEKAVQRYSPRQVVPYMVAQLGDVRPTGIRQTIGRENKNLELMRVCDLAYLFLLRNIKLSESEKTPSANTGIGAIPVLDVQKSKDEGIQELKRWWESGGKTDLEAGKLHWKGSR